MKQLLNKLFGFRYVLLVMHDGDLAIARAHKSEAGWLARWASVDRCWSLLNDDGTTSGTQTVKQWKPYIGWAKR